MHRIMQQMGPFIEALDRRDLVPSRHRSSSLSRRSTPSGIQCLADPTNNDIDLLNKAKIIQRIMRRIVVKKSIPVLRHFNPKVERSIEKFTVMLQDEVEKSLSAGIQEDTKCLGMSWTAPAATSPERANIRR